MVATKAAFGAENAKVIERSKVLLQSLTPPALAPHLISDVRDLAAWNGSSTDEINLVFVVNGNGTSAPAVQVATVVSGGGGDGSTCADAVGLLDGVAVHPVLTAAEIRYHSLALATGISYKIDYDLAGSTTIDVFGGDCDAVFGEVGGAFGSGSITVTSHTGPKVIVIINESSGTSPNEFTVTIL